MKMGKKTVTLALVLVFGSIGCAGLLFQRSLPTGIQGPKAEQLTNRIESSSAILLYTISISYKVGWPNVHPTAY